MITDGISKVRVYALAGGVSAAGAAVQTSGAAVVKFHSMHNDKLHQVYVNGRFAGVTLECPQRTILIPLPLSHKTAVRIDVFAVDEQDINIDYSESISISEFQTARARIEFAKTEKLPMGGLAEIYVNDEKVSSDPIRIKNEITELNGFGLNGFGGNFGYDGSGTVGMGRGNFGIGSFGFDADILGWQSGQLTTGVYKFNVKITDGRGSQADLIETKTAAVIAPAMPAEKLQITSFDKQKGKLILNTLQEH